MVLGLTDILEKVNQVESDRAGYVRRVQWWRQMWRLEAFKKTREEALKEKREQFVTSTPYDVINLATRLVPGRPQIECPEAYDEHTEADKVAREQFLMGLWDRNSRQGRSNIFRDLAFMGARDGRFALEIKWVYDTLPYRLRERVCPIRVIPIDPCNIGVREGPLWTELAYHKYRDTKVNIIQRYPNAKFAASKELYSFNGSGNSLDSRGYGKQAGDDEQTCEVIDFWYTSPKDGSIYNSILIDQNFVKKPQATDYVSIPIIEGGMDKAVASGETWMYNSILRGIDQNWQYESALASQVATGLMYHFWPLFMAQNEQGRPIDNLTLEPGKIKNVPWGTKFEQIMGQNNVPLAESMMDIMTQQRQKSTFVDAMYGEQGGSMQAGYGHQNMTSMGGNRINSLLDSMSYAAGAANEIALGFVEYLSDDNGVALWGYNPTTEGQSHMVLYADQINGYYENHVELKAKLPSEDLQKLTLWLRLVEMGIMSKDTFLRKGIDDRMPAHEMKKVLAEQAMADPQLAPFLRENAFTQLVGDENYRSNHGIPALGAPTPEQMAEHQMAMQQQGQAQQAQAQQQMMQAVMGGGPGGGPSPSVGPPSSPPVSNSLGPAPSQGPQSAQMMPGPPQMNGQLDENAMGMSSGVDPAAFQGLMGNSPSGPPTNPELRQMGVDI